MNKQSGLIKPQLLKTHPAFRAVSSRFIQIVSLGLSASRCRAIQMMTAFHWQVGLSVT